MERDFFDFDQIKAQYLLYKSSIRRLLFSKDTNEYEGVALSGEEIVKWVNDKGEKKFGHLHSMQKLKNEHQFLQGHAERLLNFYNQGRIQEAKSAFFLVEMGIHNVITFLDKLETKAKTEFTGKVLDDKSFEKGPETTALLEEYNLLKDREIEELKNEIQQYKNRFQLFTKATNDAIWDWDVISNKVWWNDSYRNLYGYSEEEQPVMSFDAWQLRVHPADRERVANNVNKVIDSRGNQWSDQYQFLKSNGTYATILDRGYADYDQEGRPIRMFGSMLDITRQKEAEGALQSVTSEYEFLVNTIPSLVFRTTPDGKADYVNKRWLEYTGYGKDELFENEWVKSLHVEDLDSTAKAWKEAVENVSPYQTQYRIRKHDGTYQWFEVQAVPYKDNNGNVIKWFGTCTDIEHIMRAKESALISMQGIEIAQKETEKQRKYLFSLLMQLPAPICILSQSSHILEFVNPPFGQILGDKLEMGKPFKGCIEGLPCEWFNDYVEHVYQTGEGEIIQEKVFLSNSNTSQEKVYRNIHFQRISPGITGDHDVLVFGIDVTEQVVARQKVEHSRILLQRILHGLPHVAWTFTPGSEFIDYFNQRWYEYTGRDQDDANSMEWISVLHPDDLNIAISFRDNERVNNKPFQTEQRYRRFDGEYRWHLIKIVPIGDESGKLVLWVGTATDIHDQKLAQQKLEQATKELQEKNFELDQFVYKTSHDLRAPLTTILGLVSIIKGEAKDSVRLEYVDLIENRVQKLDKFIQSMLDYSRNTRTKISWGKIDCAMLLEECLSELGSLKHFQRLKIISEIKGDDFYSDHFRLKIIFSNLISNAVKYQDFAKSESFLKIKIITNSKEARITIEDNGVGISEIYQKKIFDMFFRAIAQSEGSGLGLYIVKQAVAVLQGHILLESEAGKGILFKIVLPNHK